MEKSLHEKSTKAAESIQEIVDNILKDEEINKIDVTIRYADDTMTVIFTYEGKLSNPLTEETNNDIEKIDGDTEYSPILGFNRTYVNVPI